jgi:hypothetical protein
MYVKKPVLWFFLVAIGAIGWYLYQSRDDSASAVRPSTPAPVAQQASQPAPVVNVTVVAAAPAAPATAAAQTGSDSARAPAARPARASAPRPAADPAGVTTTAIPGVGTLRIDASAGSIVFVGDNGVLHANTGSASGGSPITLDAATSTIAAGDTLPARPAASQPASAADPSGAQATPLRASGSAAGSSTATVSRAQAAGAARSSTPAGQIFDPFAAQLGGRPVAITGYENHSVNVAGSDQIATYDDSNVFLNRDGPINANTGDTDSSGLNAVDVVDSLVRSGRSSEGDEPDDSDDDALAPTTLSGAAGDPATSAWTHQSGRGGKDTARAAEEEASASGRNPLVVGGDGYDDLSIRSSGQRNIVTYDDSNLVVGGTGPVNAQIGDSDTSGAVVMGIRGSVVEGGPSS